MAAEVRLLKALSELRARFYRLDVHLGLRAKLDKRAAAAFAHPGSV
jgi:hypothetical protein